MTVHELDPALHNEARIGIVGRLIHHRELRFSTLRDLAGLTSGNLASHLAILERSGYVSQRDAIISLRPGKARRPHASRPRRVPRVRGAP